MSKIPHIEAISKQNDRNIVYFPSSSTVYLGALGQNAYQNPMLVFGLRAKGKVRVQNEPYKEIVFTLPIMESDYDALHRVIDGHNHCSHRFSFCIGWYVGENDAVLYSTDEVHITFPSSPDRDCVTAYVFSDKVTVTKSNILC